MVLVSGVDFTDPLLPQGFFEVNGEGESMAELIKQLQALPPAALAPYRTASWKVIDI